jgi:hypothetical protein
MPSKPKFPARFTPESAVIAGKEVLLKFRFPSIVDSHRVCTICGMSIDRNSDSTPDKPKNLIQWLIDLEYIQITPSRYKYRLILGIHPRFAHHESAIAAYQQQFDQLLESVRLDRVWRQEKLNALPTINSNFRGA